MTIIADATQEEAQFMCARLQAFNQAVLGQVDFVPIHLTVKDCGGELLGGIVAEVAFDWLEIYVLWVSETTRGRGLGTTLLAACEQRALHLGAHSARLDTFDWQAEEFYRNHGYRRFASLGGYPGAHDRIFMAKRLAQTPAA